MDLSALPAVNASLNLVAALLLVRGRALIRRGRVDAHRRTMLSAFAVSTLFLAFYLLHKASRSFENTTFHAEGTAKLRDAITNGSAVRVMERMVAAQGGDARVVAEPSKLAVGPVVVEVKAPRSGWVPAATACSPAAPPSPT